MFWEYSVLLWFVAGVLVDSVGSSGALNAFQKWGPDFAIAPSTSDRNCRTESPLAGVTLPRFPTSGTSTRRFDSDLALGGCSRTGQEGAGGSKEWRRFAFYFFDGRAFGRQGPLRWQDALKKLALDSHRCLFAPVYLSAGSKP